MTIHTAPLNYNFIFPRMEMHGNTTWVRQAHNMFPWTTFPVNWNRHVLCHATRGTTTQVDILHDLHSSTRVYCNYACMVATPVFIWY